MLLAHFDVICYLWRNPNSHFVSSHLRLILGAFGFFPIFPETLPIKLPSEDSFLWGKHQRKSCSIDDVKSGGMPWNRVVGREFAHVNFEEHKNIADSLQILFSICISMLRGAIFIPHTQALSTLELNLKAKIKKNGRREFASRAAMNQLTSCKYQGLFHFQC